MTWYSAVCWNAKTTPMAKCAMHCRRIEGLALRQFKIAGMTYASDDTEQINATPNNCIVISFYCLYCFTLSRLSYLLQIQLQ